MGAALVTVAALEKVEVDYPGRGRALGVGEVKFTGMVTPQVKLVEYTVEFTRVIDRKLKLGIANGIMKADGETIYTATDMKVGLFTD